MAKAIGKAEQDIRYPTFGVVVHQEFEGKEEI
jgi:hypothetical protein